MPVPFPTLNPSTGELETVDYFTVEEVAELLHISHTTVRRRLLSGEWPHMKIAHGYFLSAEMVARVVKLSTHEPTVDVERSDKPPRLGTPLGDRDLEGMA